MKIAILKHIEKGDLKRAFVLISKTTINKIEISQLYFRFTKNEKRFKKGFLSYEEYGVEKAKLLDALIILLN